MKIDKCDIANGSGVGVVLWVSGCGVHCPGCHNAQTWDFKAGEPFTKETMLEILSACAKEHITRLTISGGHPLEPQNVHDVYMLALEFNKWFPDKELWLYTGYTLDFTTDDHGDSVIMPNGAEYDFELDELIRCCDVVVDGPYIEELRDLTLQFRGSKNQRVIDIGKSYAAEDIVLRLS